MDAPSHATHNRPLRRIIYRLAHVRSLSIHEETESPRTAKTIISLTVSVLSTSYFRFAKYRYRANAVIPIKQLHKKTYLLPGFYSLAKYPTALIYRMLNAR